jgi:hypothetical protein
MRLFGNINFLKATMVINLILAVTNSLLGSHLIASMNAVCAGACWLPIYLSKENYDYKKHSNRRQ